MCFGPSYEEKVAASEQRAAAQEEKQKAIAERANIKREDIGEALSGMQVQRGRRGGAGRRSLMTSPMGGAGYASRF